MPSPRSKPSSPYSTSNWTSGAKSKPARRTLGRVVEGEGDKQKITAKAVNARLREIGKDAEYAEEREALEEYRALLDLQADARAELKVAQEALEAAIAAKYPTLTEAEIKTLVIDDKWLATVEEAVSGELDRVSHTLTGRLRQLAERYATPLPEIVDEVAKLSSRVEQHLQQMGATWG